MGFALLDNSTLPEDVLQQTTTIKQKSEKHKVVMLIQEQEKSPMESPLTESGQWTDTGISTGELSGKVAKPTTLEGLDSSMNIDTEGDLSEISPMKDEEIVDSHSTEVEDTVMTQVSTVEQTSEKTQEVSTSPMAQELGQDKALSPMSQPEVIDASTQESKEVQDVKLSPILFLQSIGTSPILPESKDIVETGSSPPKTLMINTTTSPTKEDDKASPKSPEVPSESLEFEMSVTDDEVSKTSEALVEEQKVESKVEEVKESKVEIEKKVVIEDIEQTTVTESEQIKIEKSQETEMVQKTEITEVQIEPEMEAKVMIESPQIKDQEYEIPIVKDEEGASKPIVDKDELGHAVTIEEIEDNDKEAVKDDDDVQAMQIDECIEDMKVDQIESIQKVSEQHIEVKEDKVEAVIDTGEEKEVIEPIEIQEVKESEPKIEKVVETKESDIGIEESFEVIESVTEVKEVIETTKSTELEESKKAEAVFMAH